AYAKIGKPLELMSAAFEEQPLSPSWRGFDLLPAAARGPDEPRSPRTAVIVPDETIALEVFRQCYARGLRIPQDVAIASVMDHAPHLHPVPLTAVNGAKLMNDMAVVAAKELARLLDGAEPRAGGT